MIYLADTDGSTIKIRQQDSAVLEFKDDHEEANTKILMLMLYVSRKYHVLNQ